MTSPDTAASQQSKKSLADNVAKVQRGEVQQSHKHEDKKLDKALADSFPASDPPAQTEPHTGIKEKSPCSDAETISKN